MQNPLYIKLVVGFVLLSVLFFNVNYQGFVDAFVGANYYLMIWVAMCICASTIIGAFNLNLFVSKGVTIPFVKFIPMFWVAWASSLVVPGQVGDVLSLPALLKKHGYALHASVGRMLLDKLISFLIIFLLGVAGLLQVTGLDYQLLVVVLMVFMFGIGLKYRSERT